MAEHDQYASKVDPDKSVQGLEDADHQDPANFEDPGAPQSIGDRWELRRQGYGKLIRMVDVNQVADWMVSEVEVEGFLYQDMAVAYIAEHFGDVFISTDESGTPAISEAVLSVFDKLTQGTVTWDRWDRCWRQGRPDEPARRERST